MVESLPSNLFQVCFSPVFGAEAREKTDTAMIRWRSLWLQMPPVSFNNALPTPVIGYGLLSVGKELKMGMDHDI